MRKIFLDHASLLRALSAAATKDGVLDVIEDTGAVLICEVDDAGYKGLLEFNIPFSGGENESKKAPKKVEKPVEKKELKKNLTSTNK
jgi:hypothetical protein